MSRNTTEILEYSEHTFNHMTLLALMPVANSLLATIGFRGIKQRYEFSSYQGTEKTVKTQ